MLGLVFVEASLELVPQRLIHHPSVLKNAKREGKKPEETLLDKNLHYRAMLGIDEEEKRGRPDIIHFCLLEALGSPLNKEGNLKVAIHTIDGKAIEINPEVRLPRDCYRFKNLMERLLIEGQVPPPPKAPLLKSENISLNDLKKRFNPTKTFALTSHATQIKLDNLCNNLTHEERPLVFIGAYPHGEYRKETLIEADETSSIYTKTLEAWVVTSRIIYEYEKQSATT